LTDSARCGGPDEKIPPAPETNQMAGFVEFRPITGREKDNKNYLLSEKKRLLSGDIELIPGPVEIPNPLTYGREFMCSSSTYLLF